MKYFKLCRAIQIICSITRLKIARHLNMVFHIYSYPYIINLSMKPDELFGLMSDPTRLRSLALLQVEGELCVCELTHALELSQPKISRHLALMRESGMVEARREGTWMHYRINKDLPEWALSVLETGTTGLAGQQPFSNDHQRLEAMPNRPGASTCD
jgi:ArsR family transcriptional regulator